MVLPFTTRERFMLNVLVLGVPGGAGARAGGPRDLQAAREDLQPARPAERLRAQVRHLVSYALRRLLPPQV